MRVSQLQISLKELDQKISVESSKLGGGDTSRSQVTVRRELQDAQMKALVDTTTLHLSLPSLSPPSPFSHSLPPLPLPSLSLPSLSLYPLSLPPSLFLPPLPLPPLTLNLPSLSPLPLPPLPLPLPPLYPSLPSSWLPTYLSFHAYSDELNRKMDHKRQEISSNQQALHQLENTVHSLKEQKVRL